MFSWLNIRIGWYLAVRQIQRSSFWTTGLIVFVMVLTFLNLVVVSGILVGLIQGSIDAERKQYTSDVILSTLNDKKYIENSPNIISIVKSLPEVESFSARYIEGGALEANYRTRKSTDKPNIAAAQITGINPLAENEVTGLADKMIEGSYLESRDYDKVIIGYYLLKQYIKVNSPDFVALENVGVGTKIRINVGGVVREVTVKGIIKSKVQEVSRNVYLLDSQLRSMIGRNDGNVDQIAIKLKAGTDSLVVKNALVLSGVESYAKVQTYVDAQPQFLKDIVATFSILGTAFSSIGLVVASVTIFIVVFINAITRRKFIGILKGIGIDGHAIEIAYIFQSIFYALCGSIIGLCIVYGFLSPAISAHPIDFPFSDGILVAPIGETLFRVLLLVVSTIVAGYIPAWMIIRKNTLDSILGRN